MSARRRPQGAAPAVWRGVCRSTISFRKTRWLRGAPAARLGTDRLYPLTLYASRRYQPRFLFQCAPGLTPVFCRRWRQNDLYDSFTGQRIPSERKEIPPPGNAKCPARKHGKGGHRTSGRAVGYAALAVSNCMILTISFVSSVRRISLSTQRCGAPLSS